MNMYQFINNHAIVVRPDWLLSKAEINTQSTYQSDQNSSANDNNAQNKTKQRISYVRDVMKHFDPDENYGQWFKGLAAINHEFNGSMEGKNLAREWSKNQLDPQSEIKGNFDQENFESTWDSIKGTENPVTIASFTCLLPKDILRQINEKHHKIMQSENSSDPFLNIYPDMTLLDPETPPAPNISIADWKDIFGEAVYNVIEDAAQSSSAPKEYIVSGLLSSVSSLLCKTRKVEVQNGWQEKIAIWSMIVGDPSFNKTPALNTVIKPLEDIQSHEKNSYKKALSEWKEKKELGDIAEKKWKKDVREALEKGETPPEKPEIMRILPKPKLKRFISTNTTIEKLTELINENDRGPLLFQDELSMLLGNMFRYSGGNDQPLYLQCYNGGGYTVDRMNKEEPLIVDNLICSILGGIQPDILNKFISGNAIDGFFERFLPFYPDAAPLHRYTGNGSYQAIYDAFKKLKNLPLNLDNNNTPQYKIITLSADAKDYHFKCRETFNSWSNDASGILKGHYGKYHGMIIRIACVLKFLDFAFNLNTTQEPNIIDLDALKRAMAFLEQIVKPHAERVYGIGSCSPEVLGAMKIAKIIDEGKLHEISVREIQQRRLNYLGKADEIRKAIDVLIQGGWTSPINDGKKSPKIYRINLKVHTFH